MHVVSRQRRVVMIRTDRTGKRTVAMAVRMHMLVVAPGRRARPHEQRRRMPGPGHQDGESEGEDHLGADGFAEHGSPLR